MLTWLISAAAIAGILFRPKAWPEAVWACTGALLLMLFRQLSLPEAALAAGKGIDVYLFLTGMMLLADLARREGVFDWIASLAFNAAKGSPARLFTLVYAAGVVVTVFLSNDATAVVLTPAVYAAVKRVQGAAQPCLFACAFVANAASFVLPISNPANLVVYGKNLPPLLAWLRVFALPSLVSIAATFLALRLLSRRELAGHMDGGRKKARLSSSGCRAVWGIAFTAVVLIGASAFGRDLGLPTCLTATAVLLIATRTDWRAIRDVVRGVSWSVIPLVAGLFILVEGMNRAGGSRIIGLALRQLSQLPVRAATLGASFSAAALCNLMNNLPAGLLIGSQVPVPLRAAVLVGVDLGPNLSITGSLATVLWLIALRREGVNIDGWTFLKAGLIVMAPALALATLAL